MDVNNFIALYSILQGFKIYGIIWTVLVGTGLAFLPVIGLVIDTAQSARAQGSVMANDAEDGLSALEVGVFRMLFVVVLAVAPNGLTTVSAANLNVDGATASETNTNYDETFGSDVSIVGASVAVPVWWYGVLAVSNGITKAVIEEVGENTTFRELEAALRTGTLKSPELRMEAQVFANECWIPARANAYDQGEDNPDVDWPGSLVLYNNYYEGMHTETILPGFPPGDRLAEFETNAPDGGRPDCTVLWTHIENGIFEQAQDDGVVALATIVDAAVFGKRQIARRYLLNTDIGPRFSADEIQQMRDPEGGGLVDWASTHLENFSLTGAALKAEMAVSGVVIAISVVQPIVLMLLIIFIPIGMLISGYSISFMVQGAVLLFTVTFWSALWALVAVFDAHLSNSFMDSISSRLLTKLADPEVMQRELIINLTVLGLYTVVPVVASWMLIAAGSSAARAISGSVGATSGVNAAHGSTNIAQTGNQARNAGRHAVSAGRLGRDAVSFARRYK